MRRDHFYALVAALVLGTALAALIGYVLAPNATIF